MKANDPRHYARPGSLLWQFASLKPGEHFIQQVGEEGIQTRQSMNSSAIHKLRKFPGCESRGFAQRAFYAVDLIDESVVKFVRITRTDDPVEVGKVMP